MRLKGGLVLVGQDVYKRQGQECRHFADINGPVEELPRVLSTPRQYAYLRIACLLYTSRCV